MSRNHGRHELGQNFLVDPAVVNQILNTATAWPDRPILELGPGDGALTDGLAALGRPLTAVELDPHRVERLRRRFDGRAEIIHGDLLDAELCGGADIVSNVPYGITTPFLRKLLAADGWQNAIVLVQWEVARKRAGVGGTTMMTAQWWPWFSFDLVGRVPASAFRPRPSVDGGLLVIRRRPEPLVDVEQRREYQQLVGAVFSGRGKGVREIVRRHCGPSAASSWANENNITHTMLPKDLNKTHWTNLWAKTQAQRPRP